MHICILQNSIKFRKLAVCNDNAQRPALNLEMKNSIGSYLLHARYIYALYDVPQCLVRRHNILINLQ